MISVLQNKNRNKKRWKRECPRCKIELTYCSRQNLWRANKLKSVCLKCRGYLSRGDKHSSKRPDVRKKIGDSCRKYDIPDKIVLDCSCKRKIDMGRQNYIAFYVRNKIRVPRCRFCINKEIADNMDKDVKKRRSKKMSEIMAGRNITWNDSLIKNHWARDPKKRKRVIEKQSKTKSKLISEGKIKFNTGFKCGYYMNKKNNILEYYQSSYELRRMIALDQDETVISWTKAHGIRIPYTYKNSQKHYVPDFLILYDDGKKILEEVKGYVKNKKIFKLQQSVAKKYCKLHNMSYIINYDNF